MPFNVGGGNAPGPGEVICQEVLFTEVSNTGGVYTGSVTVPPNSWIVDIRVYGQALWTSATSATLKVGDVADDDGWFIGINVKATDLLVGEVLHLGAGGTGGKPGAYYVAASGLRSTMWAATERIVSGKITTVTTAASIAGRTRMLVIYTSATNPINATFA